MDRDRLRQDLERGLAAIRHRGPDDVATWCSEDGRFALGHARLSIIGLAHGRQPLRNAAGDVRCVVNGELYGHRRIRAQLEAAGATMRTDSDSEIALHLYEKHSEAFVEQLRGEFAIVVADERRNRLVAVRDRFGIKPLYYARHGDRVLFANELKALFAMGVVPRWDTEGVVAELHGVLPADQTLFAGIRAVPPGCLIVVDPAGLRTRRYWDIDFPTQQVLANDARTDAEVAEGLRERLEDAVRQRLVADVEVACYLSGGIDSSAVLGLAQRQLTDPIRAFTIVFDEQAYDESEIARRTAESMGSKLVPVPVDQAKIVAAFPDAVRHAETLLRNGHAVAKYLLSGAVHDAGIKVVLTGEGSDEVFAGYPPFRQDMVLYNSGLDPESARRAADAVVGANSSSRGVLTADGGTSPGLGLVQQRLGYAPSAMAAYSTAAVKLYPCLRDGLLDGGGGGGAGSRAYQMLLASIDVPGQLTGRDPLNQSLYLWSRSQLATYILTVLGDRMEMAHSVEGRLPFLDNHVAEYAVSLPVRHKVRGLREKHVLREATRDVVLPEVYDRQKHPFMSPPARGGRDPLAAYCHDVLRSGAVESQPVFDPDRLRAMVDALDRLDPAARAASESSVLLATSLTVLQELFHPSAE